MRHLLRETPADKKLAKTECRTYGLGFPDGREHRRFSSLSYNPDMSAKRLGSSQPVGLSGLNAVIAPW